MKTNKMIRIAVILLTIVPFMARAQVSFGTRQGITISTLSKPGDLYDNDQLTVSYTGGVFASIPLVKNLAVQPEINYIRKGRCSENNISGTSQETTCKYNYLQVPVLARYSSSLSGYPKSSIFFNAGPYAAVLLKSERNLSNGNELPASQVTETDKSPDLGLILGGGITFPVNKFKFQVDLRYDMGLSKLDNQPDDYRTKALSLAVGIAF